MDDTMEIFKVIKVEHKLGRPYLPLAEADTQVRFLNILCRLVLFEMYPTRFEPFVRDFLDEWEQLWNFESVMKDEEFTRKLLNANSFSSCMLRAGRKLVHKLKANEAKEKSGGCMGAVGSIITDDSALECSGIGVLKWLMADNDWRI
jgi:hypothetical protein